MRKKRRRSRRDLGFYIPRRLNTRVVTMNSIFGRKTNLKNSLEKFPLIRERKWNYFGSCCWETMRLSTAASWRRNSNLLTNWYGKLLSSFHFLFVFAASSRFQSTNWHVYGLQKNKERRKLLIKTLSLEKFQLVRMFLTVSSPCLVFTTFIITKQDQNTKTSAFFPQQHQWFTIVFSVLWLILCCWAFVFNYLA